MGGPAPVQAGRLQRSADAGEHGRKGAAILRIPAIRSLVVSPR